MNKIAGILTVAASLMLGVAGTAMAEVKVGFVNSVKLMEQAPQAKAAFSRMESEFSPREKELVDLQRDIKKLEDKLALDGAVMSEAEQARLDRDIRNRKRELKRSQDEWREDVNIRRNEELSKLQRRLSTAITNFGKELKFDVILESGVVFVSDRVDITEQVLKHLKADFDKENK